MKIFLTSIFLLLGALGISQETINPENSEVLLPLIKWDIDTYNLGKIKRGEKRELTYSFTNVGNTELIIELVTACRCTALDWPKEPIPPGGTGMISVSYDSTGQKLGPVTKTVDVISNTEPIVVEAFFMVDVIE